MSLSDVVLEIAEEMKQEGEKTSNLVLQAYAVQLRRAVKAAGEPRVVDYAAAARGVDHRTMIDLEREKIRHRNALIEHGEGPRMAECKGGDSHGSMVQIDTRMPCGARARVAGEVYALGEDGLLHRVE